MCALNKEEKKYYGENPKTNEELKNYIKNHFDMDNYPQTTQTVIDFVSQNTCFESSGVHGPLEQAVNQFKSIVRAKKSDQEAKDLIIKGLTRTTAGAFTTGMSQKDLIIKGLARTTAGAFTTEMSPAAETFTTKNDSENLSPYEKNVQNTMIETDAVVTDYLDTHTSLSPEEKKAKLREINKKIYETSNKFQENKKVQEAVEIWQDAIEKVFENKVKALNSEVLNLATNFSKLSKEDQEKSKIKIINKINLFQEENSDKPDIKKILQPWIDIVKNIKPIDESGLTKIAKVPYQQAESLVNQFKAGTNEIKYGDVMAKIQEAKEAASKAQDNSMVTYLEQWTNDVENLNNARS